jgi:hypothetical protein
LTARPISQVLPYIVHHFGARPADRHPIDQRIIDDFLAREGGIIDSQTEVGGYPTDVPTSRTLEVPDENVEDWLNQMAADLEAPDNAASDWTEY